MTTPHNDRLSRKLNTTDAVLIGLGAMIGSGIFVAIAPAVDAAGSGVLLGLCLAAVMAYCNATSSAQLAALYPESGGTYVYGRKRLGLFWGWLAGWGFVVGKIASCAAAALSFGHYLYAPAAKWLAMLAVVALTAANYRGIEKTLTITRLIVALVLFSLSATVLACLAGGSVDVTRLTPITGSHGLSGILQSGAILFFAFAGYARIATLGEEIKDPRQAIPKAIVISLMITLVVYFLVITSVLLAAGEFTLAQTRTPLVSAVEVGRLHVFSPIVRLGAVVASLGVLLSLMLGISRTMFSMAGNKDLPGWLAVVHPLYKVPHHAELCVAIIISTIIAVADIRQAIGFSAFTILIYYAITNACAWTLSGEQRLWPRWLCVLGLAGCLLLALSLPSGSVVTGVIVMAIGTAVFAIRKASCKIG